MKAGVFTRTPWIATYYIEGTMKSLVDLFEDLLLDCGRRCGAAVARDVGTLRARVEHEGDSFVTITLPNFCRDFERCLDLGRLAPGAFNSFRKEKTTGTPSFLKGFLCQVFDTGGCLLLTPSIDCIRAIRQICLFGKKIVRQCSQARLDKAIAAYKQCEDGIVDPKDCGLERAYRKVCSLLVGELNLREGFAALLDPRHGPGQTEERLRGNAKWAFRSWHRRLTDVGFSYALWGRGSQHEPKEDEGEFAHERAISTPASLEPEDEPPVRVVFVPKTLKTPRVIAVEPVCMQYAQQGIARLLMRRLEKSPLTRKHVNFSCQDVNQDLAKDSSKDGKLATIDMSEASDRVSLAHVSQLLESAPELREWVLACRSTSARLPSGERIHLKKFASMGSALCFPMESLVFYAKILASRCYRAGKFPTRRLLMELSRDVYVYGDDLVLPSDEAPAICADLEASGLKVNTHKSFWTGKFRESCGMDSYDGECVTPTYLRRDLPASRNDIAGILSSVATANQLFSAGLTKAAAGVQASVERWLGKLPTVPEEGPAIGWHHTSDTVPRRRWNRHLQRFEYLCYVTEPTRTADPLDGEPALAKCLFLLGRNTQKTTGAPPQETVQARCNRITGVKTYDPDHLATSVTPYGVALKRRWVEWS